eukprot:TRINITY_DN7815_c0_g2_i3.p1 TRINITY_DN7815_c0_g2~~TRINITY_DN7815_c0_g2_i3.p1  ORF type:complete len:112 (-),score=25.01 TRINITY_DN7815_c0_g2_i3:41-376(-)
MNFTQSQYQDVKASYKELLKAYSSVRELDILLTMLTEYNNTQTYIDAINKGFNAPLVDVVLFCMLGGLDATVYYLSTEGLSKLELSFGSQDHIRIYPVSYTHLTLPTICSV